MKIFMKNIQLQYYALSMIFLSQWRSLVASKGVWLIPAEPTGLLEWGETQPSSLGAPVTWALYPGFSLMPSNHLTGEKNADRELGKILSFSCWKHIFDLLI